MNLSSHTRVFPKTRRLEKRLGSRDDPRNEKYAWNICSHECVLESVPHFVGHVGFPDKIISKEIGGVLARRKEVLVKEKGARQDQHCVVSFELVVSSHTSHSHCVHHAATDSTTTRFHRDRDVGGCAESYPSPYQVLFCLIVCDRPFSYFRSFEWTFVSSEGSALAGVFNNPWTIFLFVM